MNMGYNNEIEDTYAVPFIARVIFYIARLRPKIYI